MFHRETTKKHPYKKVFYFNFFQMQNGERSLKLIAEPGNLSVFEPLEVATPPSPRNLSDGSCAELAHLLLDRQHFHEILPTSAHDLFIDNPLAINFHAEQIRNGVAGWYPYDSRNPYDCSVFMKVSYL